MRLAEACSARTKSLKKDRCTIYTRPRSGVLARLSHEAMFVTKRNPINIGSGTKDALASALKTGMACCGWCDVLVDYAVASTSGDD